MKHQKAQLDLLAEACRSHQPVRIDQQRADTALQLDGAFLGCDERGVMVELLDSPELAGFSKACARVRAHFGLRGRRYSFVSPVQGAFALPARANRERIGLKLALPLVVCERSHRRSERIRASDQAAIAVRLTLIQQSDPVETQLYDLSESGLSVEIPSAAAERFGLSCLLRAQILPTDPAIRCECMLRVVHKTAVDAFTRVGMVFVGRDDSMEFDNRIKRLQDWIVDALRREKSRAAADDGGSQ